MPVRATLRSSLRDPDLGTSLYSAGAAPSRILFKRLFCARARLMIVLLVLLLLLGLFVLFVLKRRTTIKEAL